MKRTKPYQNLTEIEMVLHDLEEQMEVAVTELDEADNAASALRFRADKIEDRAFLREDGAMDLRKRKSKLAASDAEWLAIVEELKVRKAKAKIKKIEFQLDVTRSIGAYHRAEAAAVQGNWNTGV